MSGTVYYTWVLARYRYNEERAKNALNHPTNYKVINPERGRTEDVIVAFKYILGAGPIPAHLTEASKAQQDSLEKWSKPWNHREQFK